MNGYQVSGWHSSYLAIIMTWCVGLLAGHTLHQGGAEILMSLPVSLGQWLRQLSLSGGSGNIAAWAVMLTLCALPALGLLAKGRRKADWILPLISLVMLAWIFYLVNPTMLGTTLPAEQGWALCGMAVVGSLLVSWVLLRLLAKLDTEGTKLLPKIFLWGVGLYVFLLGAGTVLQTAAEVAAVEAANTAAPDIAKFTVSTLHTLAAWKSVPSLIAAALVMWGGDLLQALEEDPFSEETVTLAEQVAKRCDWMVYITLFVTVSCNLMQMTRFGRLADVDVQVYFPVMPLALAAVLRTLCRYFRKAKAVSDDNDTII